MKLPRIFYLSALLHALSIVLISVSADAREETPQKKLAPVLQPYVDSETMAGAVVLVGDPEKILDLEAVGWRDIAEKAPMRTDAMFWIASQSKPITCTALMILVDEGKVRLDDPVEKYLPEFKNITVAKKDGEPTKPKQPMLVRHVMSHTSGLPGITEVMKPTLDGRSLAEMVAGNVAEPLLTEPGTAYQYSNPGINTVGRIIEVVSGMPYEHFLEKRIFQPLGMTDTTFWPDDEQLARLAKSYRPGADKTGLEETNIGSLKYPLNDRTSRFAFPGGGLFSTATDLFRFYRMVANDGVVEDLRILSKESLALMTADQTGELKKGYGFGFGFGTNGAVVTHGGAYNTNSAFDRERNLITVFLGQHAGWPEGGKDILPTFQRTAREMFGKEKAGGTAAPPVVGIPGER